VLPKLSIVTPSFNQGAFIERTIRSVLEQRYENLEYVIVDGGSTDESVEIIRRYEDDLAWWVSEPDEGQTEAINKGIERTSGEIVAFVNSDDHYLPGAFEKVVRAFAETDAKWVAGAAIDRDERDRDLQPEPWRPSQPWQWERRPLGRQWWLMLPWCVPQPSAFWRRELFDELGLFRTDMHFAFDAEFELRCVFAGHMPLLLRGEVLSARVRHGEQKSSDMSRFRPEIDRFREIYWDRLTPRERRRLNLARAMTRSGLLPRWDDFNRAMVDPVLRFGGRMLDYVPDRWRPPIRHRDRRPPGTFPQRGNG